MRTWMSLAGICLAAVKVQTSTWARDVYKRQAGVLEDDIVLGVQDQLAVGDEVAPLHRQALLVNLPVSRYPDVDRHLEDVYKRQE